MLSLDVDLQKVRDDFARIYRDLRPEQIERATYRALNHTMRSSRVAAARYTRDRLRIKVSAAKRQIKPVHARQGKLWAGLRAKSEPMRVAHFKHSTRKGRKGARGSHGARPGSGVSVAISRGKRKVIKRAFTARVRKSRGGGHYGVFARGRYVRGRGFVFAHGKGSGRFPMTQLRTTSVPQKIDDKDLQAILQRKNYTDFPKRLNYLMARDSRFGASAGAY